LTVITTKNVAVYAKGVTRAFGGRDILRGLDISIAPGEFVALLGRSGTGKSTLLRILGGLDPDYGGEVLVPRRRAVVFQEPRLLPWQRVLPNVTLGLKPVGPNGSGQLRQQSLDALREVGLADHARAWPVTLSGGEAQRVALARALVREPQLMLLDEPFGALDALTRTRMHGLLQDLCARHNPAVLLVTHDVDEAIGLADRVLVLVDGTITVDLPVALSRPRDRGHAEFTSLRTRLLAELGVTERPLLLPGLSAWPTCTQAGRAPRPSRSSMIARSAIMSNSPSMPCPVTRAVVPLPRTASWATGVGPVPGRNRETNRGGCWNGVFVGAGLMTRSARNSAAWAVVVRMWSNTSDRGLGLLDFPALSGGITGTAMTTPRSGSISSPTAKRLSGARRLLKWDAITNAGRLRAAKRIPSSGLTA
jgi:sulfonate transport system ATP-binding protein